MPASGTRPSRAKDGQKNAFSPTMMMSLAGMSLALASDIIIVGENAFFCPSFARLGLVPDAGITFHLARRIGGGRSLSALMLAEKIHAQQALDWGLAYAVAPDTEVVAQAQAVARRLASGPCA